MSGHDWQQDERGTWRCRRCGDVGVPAMLTPEKEWPPYAGTCRVPA